MLIISKMQTLEESIIIIITIDCYNNRVWIFIQKGKKTFIHPCMMLILKRYTLDESSLKIDITASTDKATVVNIRFDT